MSSSQSSSERPFQVFPLEPILTPSAFLEIPEEGTDSIDLFSDTEVITALTQSTNTPDFFNAGVFTVGQSGQVSLDFLFDGGVYQGEMAVFSLEGMTAEPGTSEFIHEAAQRALSNSELGHVVISDPLEGARFSGKMGEPDFNSGTYLGVKTFEMKAGDRFGVMLAANQTIEEVADGKTWAVRFSMATANPDDNFQFGQIADVTGDGNTFTFEDLNVGQRSDRDYNDIIFNIRGATAEAPTIDDLIDERFEDWRETEIGQDILNYVRQDPELIQPIEDVVLTPDPQVNTADYLTGPTQTLDLNDFFADADSSELSYEIVNGEGDAVLFKTMPGEQLALTKGAENGITDVALRVTDESGNFYIHSFRVITHNLVEAEFEALDAILLTLHEVMTDSSDLSTDLSSPLGQSALAELQRFLVDHPGIEEILADPDALTSIGIGEEGVEAMQQLLTDGEVAAALALSEPLLEALESQHDPSLDLYQINAQNLAEALAQGAFHPSAFLIDVAAMPLLGVIDFRRDGHSQDVTTTIAAVNPLASTQSLHIDQGDWASQLVNYVNTLQAQGETKGVVNLSLDLTQVDSEGNVTTRYQLTSEEQQALNYAREHNVLVVVAAGNTGDQMSALGTAAQTFDNLVTVGASDFWGDRALYSSYGQGLTLMAPGGEFNGDPQAFVGTSKAAAYVSGAVSLVWAANPGLNYQQVKGLLQETALDLDVPGWDRETGAGLLNVEAAVRQARETEAAPLPFSQVELDLIPFVGAGRVQVGARAASPETEAAIAALQSRKAELEAKLAGSTLTPAELQAAVDQLTEQVLSEFSQISTAVVTSEAQARQLTTELALAEQHQAITQQQVESLGSTVAQLNQTIAALTQQQDTLTQDFQQQEQSLNEQITQVTGELQTAQTAYDEAVQQAQVPPTANALRDQADWYSQQVDALAAKQAELLEQAQTQEIFQDQLLQQAQFLAQTQTLIEQLVAGLTVQATRLEESTTTPEALAQGYQTLANFAQAVQQDATSHAAWHQQELAELDQTTGMSGILISAQRESHIEQRNQFEAIANTTTPIIESATYQAGLPSAQRTALEQAVQAQEHRLQSEQDFLNLTQADYERELAVLTAQIAAAETALADWEAKQSATEAANDATATRVIQTLDALTPLQEQWEATRNQWQDYLNLNSAFLPQTLRQAIGNEHLGRLDAEEVRIQELITDLQQRLATEPDEILQQELTDAQEFLSELEQERALVLLHQDSLTSPASTSSHYTSLLERPDSLEQSYKPLHQQWQTATAAQTVIIQALDALQAQATTEREDLAALEATQATLTAELATAQSQQAELEAASLQAQQDLDLNQLQLTNQQLLLESLLARDVALAAAETFYGEQAAEQQAELWYWNDQESRFQYNEQAAQLYQDAQQHQAFLAEERNRVFAATQAAQDRIAELTGEQPGLQQQLSDVQTQLAATIAQISQQESSLAQLEAAIAPLSALVWPLLAQEAELLEQLATANTAVDEAIAELVATASAQVAALRRLITMGVLAAEDDTDQFTTVIKPQVEAAITALSQHHADFTAEGLDLGFAEAAAELAEQLALAQEAVDQLAVQEARDAQLDLGSHTTRQQALEALLASEEAAETAIQDDTVAAYDTLATTVVQDLEQAITAWTQQFQESHQLTTELGDEQGQLSTRADELVTYIQTQFADPNGVYYRSETELQEALSVLAVGLQREDELNQTLLQHSQSIARLEARLTEDEQFWTAIAPIVATYGVDSKTALQNLLSAARQEQEQYAQQLAEAKQKYEQAKANGNVNLIMAQDYADRAAIAWEKSEKQGPTWNEERYICNDEFFGLKDSCGWRTITHTDTYWLQAESNTEYANASREQGLELLAEAEEWRKEIERLEALVQNTSTASQSAEQAEGAYTQTENLIAQFESDLAENPALQTQRETLEALLPLLEQQLQDAEQQAAAAQTSVETAWQDYDPAAAAYRTAIADVLNQQSDWLQQATATQNQIATTEQWIERQTLALNVEQQQVLVLKDQLEAQETLLEAQLFGATGATLVEVQAKLDALQKSLSLVSNKAAVLSAQQAALTQHRAVLAAQNEVITVEQRLLAATINSPDADTTALEQQLNDARAALAEAQQFADQAAANSQILTAPLQELQTELLAQNDAHLQAAREQQALVSELLAVTETNANYTLQAAQAQQNINDLEFQIITRLQEATAAGNEEAKHLLNVALYNDLATAAEIYFRDYQDLASDQGSKYGSDGVADDAVLAEQYRAEMENYQALKAQEEQQVAAFKATKEAAQAQVESLEQAQQQALAELEQIQGQITSSREEIDQKEQALAVLEARVADLAALRQQTEQTFVQVVRLEQLNLAQAELLEQVATERKAEIDQAVEDRLERERIELERQRLEVQFQIESLKQQQTQEALRQALNQVRTEVGQAELAGSFDPTTPQNIAALTALLATLNEQPELPPNAQALLDEVQAEIALAQQGQASETIQENLLQVMQVLMEQADQYKAELTQLEQQEQADQQLLELVRQDLQAASQQFLAESQRSEVLGEEREIINPLYLETLTKVAHAEQAVEISEELAQQARDILNQIIDQRVEARKQRKKAYWNKILSTVSSIIGIVGIFFPPLAIVSSAINAIQAAVNGDWAGALFSAVMAGVGYITNGLESALGGALDKIDQVKNVAEKLTLLKNAQQLQSTLNTINTLKAIASGAFQSIRSLASGENVMAFLQMVGGVASGAFSSLQSFTGQLTERTQQFFNSFPETAYLFTNQASETLLGVLGSLQQAPQLIYSGIQSIEEGDWFSGIQSTFNAALSIGNSFITSPNSEIGQAFKTLEQIGGTGFALAGAAKEDGLNAWLDGLGDIAGLWKDDIEEFVDDIYNKDEPVLITDDLLSDSVNEPVAFTPNGRGLTLGEFYVDQNGNLYDANGVFIQSTGNYHPWYGGYYDLDDNYHDPEGSVHSLSFTIGAFSDVESDFIDADNSSGEPPTEYSHEIESGETLWHIALRELGDGSRWREIQKSDGSYFTEEDAQSLYVGQSIYLPEKGSANNHQVRLIGIPDYPGAPIIVAPLPVNSNLSQSEISSEDIEFVQPTESELLIYGPNQLYGPTKPLEENSGFWSGVWDVSTDYIPGISNVASAVDGVDDIWNGNYGSGLVNLGLATPGIGNVGKYAKNARKLWDDVARWWVRRRVKKKLSSQGLPKDYIENNLKHLDNDELKRIHQSSRQWNIVDKKNQGYGHIVTHEKAQERLDRLSKYSKSESFSIHDKNVMPKVTSKLEEIWKNTSNSDFMKVSGKKEFRFLPADSTKPLSNSTKGIRIQKYDGKFSTFHSTDFRTFKGSK